MLSARWAVGLARRTSSLPVRPWYWTDLPLSLPERHACGTTHTCTGLFRPEVRAREGEGALQPPARHSVLRLCSATQSSGGTRALT